mmetsp:Transcript_9077/g.22535  ORF Transcript_9077/g.22535 Transcript_9077/m.22535 type:complete len:289 (+) Transcript_9077:276-1142(+)
MQPSMTLHRLRPESRSSSPLVSRKIVRPVISPAARNSSFQGAAHRVSPMSAFGSVVALRTEPTSLRVTRARRRAVQMSRSSREHTEAPTHAQPLRRTPVRLRHEPVWAEDAMQRAPSAASNRSSSGPTKRSHPSSGAPLALSGRHQSQLSRIASARSPCVVSRLELSGPIISLTLVSQADGPKASSTKLVTSAISASACTAGAWTEEASVSHDWETACVRLWLSSTHAAESCPANVAPASATLPPRALAMPAACCISAHAWCATPAGGSNERTSASSAPTAGATAPLR